MGKQLICSEYLPRFPRIIYLGGTPQIPKLRFSLYISTLASAGRFGMGSQRDESWWPNSFPLKTTHHARKTTSPQKTQTPKLPLGKPRPQTSPSPAFGFIRRSLNSRASWGKAHPHIPTQAPSSRPVFGGVLRGWIFGRCHGMVRVVRGVMANMGARKRR